MTKAIEHIVAGYSTLKNRKALEEIRDHRKRLLMENRMSAASSGFNLDRITTDLQEEISIVETALSRFQDGGSSQPDCALPCIVPSWRLADPAKDG